METGEPIWIKTKESVFQAQYDSPGCSKGWHFIRRGQCKSMKFIDDIFPTKESARDALSTAMRSEILRAEMTVVKAQKRIKKLIELLRKMSGGANE